VSASKPKARRGAGSRVAKPKRGLGPRGGSRPSGPRGDAR
jgi:hypothetical protein